MKKLILLSFALFAFTIFANAQDTIKTSSGLDVYVAVGVSAGNTGTSATLNQTSYPSAEVGIMKGNFALGLVGGRSSFDFEGDDVTENYWMSLKAAIYFPIGNSKIDGYGLLAVGNYLSTDQVFIEYGVGMSRAFDSGFGVFGQASNWDNYWYITPGLSYTF